VINDLLRRECLQGAFVRVELPLGKGRGHAPNGNLNAIAIVQRLCASMSFPTSEKRIKSQRQEDQRQEE
jgi:hypothetical protein